MVCVLLLAFAPPELNVCSGAAVEAWQARARSIGLARSPGGRAVRAAPSGLRKAREDAVLASEVLLEDRRAAAGGGVRPQSRRRVPRAPCSRKGRPRSVSPSQQARSGHCLCVGSPSSTTRRWPRLSGNSWTQTSPRRTCTRLRGNLGLHPASARRSNVGTGAQTATARGVRTTVAARAASLCSGAASTGSPGTWTYGTGGACAMAAIGLPSMAPARRRSPPSLGRGRERLGAEGNPQAEQAGGLQQASWVLRCVLDTGEKPTRTCGASGVSILMAACLQPNMAPCRRASRASARRTGSRASMSTSHPSGVNLRRACALLRLAAPPISRPGFACSTRPTTTCTSNTVCANTPRAASRKLAAGSVLLHASTARCPAPAAATAGALGGAARRCICGRTSQQPCARTAAVGKG